MTAAEGEQEEQRVSTRIKGELHPINPFRGWFLWVWTCCIGRYWVPVRPQKALKAHLESATWKDKPRVSIHLQVLIQPDSQRIREGKNTCPSACSRKENESGT